ncbi:predicted protein [Nematostella vectensis]|uniref:Uncharacterized protein n=1 Tax=Nematostella vectensis TaxID=45351 RepID=A7SWB8_NEMVE|nr:predicted protein [Nematostella vectensis]|eukprot:XP_001624077.1 predicted protein [Nematostella vectensis]
MVLPFRMLITSRKTDAMTISNVGETSAENHTAWGDLQMASGSIGLVLLESELMKVDLQMASASIGLVLLESELMKVDLQMTSASIGLVLLKSELMKLTEFIEENLDGQKMPRQLEKVIEVVKINIQWRATHEKSLEAWLVNFLTNKNIPSSEMNSGFSDPA